MSKMLKSQRSKSSKEQPGRVGRGEGMNAEGDDGLCPLSFVFCLPCIVHVYILRFRDAPQRPVQGS